MISKKFTLDSLTENSVSVKTQRYYDGIALGEPHRKAYVNSMSGRELVQSELTVDIASAILTVWGDVPTVDDSVE